MAQPLRVVITGAAGQIGYSLCAFVAMGDVFGKEQPLELMFLDIPPMMESLEGLKMEINDCSAHLVRNMVATADPKVAFKDADVAFMVGAMPRREGMERKDLLHANVKIFKAQGEAMNEVAKKTIKVVVVGNPANTNACILSRYAPSIPKENFTCLTRLDQNRAQYQIAAKLGVPSNHVKNIIIWGNHSSTQFPDAAHAKVKDAQVKSGNTWKSVPEAVADDNFLKNDFIKTVQQRGAAIIKARKLSSAMSAAKAACDHVHDWFMGTNEGDWVSMGVISDGSYGVPEGIMYSFPVKIEKKEWSIVQGLKIDDFAKEKMEITAQELQTELKDAIEVCH